MTFTKPIFPAAAIADAKEHARSVYPQESCGLIVGDVKEAFYIRCQNRAADPLQDFLIDPEQLLTAGAQLLAVVHSHPNGVAQPSAADMRGQMDSGCIWGVLAVTGQDVSEPVWWGDYRLEQPLVGRDFILGISDCYSLIRAWYWQERKVKLPDFAREGYWWKDGTDLYGAGFSQAGFVPVALEEVRYGDVFLGQVRSPVPNHGGVLLADGLMLHHVENRLSRHEPFGAWQKYITHYLRFVGLPHA